MEIFPFHHWAILAPLLSYLRPIIELQLAIFHRAISFLLLSYFPPILGLSSSYCSAIPVSSLRYPPSLYGAIPVSTMSYPRLIMELSLSNHWAIPVSSLSYPPLITELSPSHYWAFPFSSLCYPTLITEISLSHHWAIPLSSLSYPPLITELSPSHHWYIYPSHHWAIPISSLSYPPLIIELSPLITDLSPPHHWAIPLSSVSYPHLIIENPLSIRKLFVCGIPVSLIRMPGAYTLLVLTGGPLSSRHSNITVAEPIPDQPLLPQTCSDIVYAEIRFKQSSSLKLYFLMASTVVDSKPEKVLNVYTK